MDNWVLNLPKELWPEFLIDETNKAPFLIRFFETQKNVVVLSSSNKVEKEVNERECVKNNIPILQRKGGGGTVVLGQGCLVLTFAFYGKDVFGNSKYFQMINNLWIEALEKAGCPKLNQQGISDISYSNKKIAGTSIFRKKHLLVYQGSLLVNPNLDLITKLLSHPSREPDYRKGRSHAQFLTTTQALGCLLSASELALFCQKYFEENVGKYFKSDVLI